MKAASFILFFILTSVALFSQKLNQYNKKGERTGRWLTYSDPAKTKKLFEGRYKKGNSVGICSYYNLEGNLERIERKRFRRIKTSIYRTDGTLSHEGKARIDNLPEKIHYYFYGTWKYYDTTGKLYKYGYYEKGILVKTRYVDKSIKTNDSLMFALNNIENEFNRSNVDLLDSLAHCWSSPTLSEKFRNRIYSKDSLPFKKIEFILNTYGYPNKEMCNEAVVIPFYIMSHAPYKLRLKHVELFKAVAGIGIISKKSLAFYIDKLKLSAGEKQIYGTQYYLDKNYSGIGTNSKLGGTILGILG
jgi:hypothetical protein